jgi:hypothetical protein
LGALSRVNRPAWSGHDLSRDPISFSGQPACVVWA